MSEPSPFANWPNRDDREKLRDPSAPLPGAPGAPVRRQDNALESFLGGSPVAVAMKLIFMSLVVGALLMWLNLRPHDILLAIRGFIDAIYNMGFDAIRALGEYVVAGAAIVVPAWLILRLMNAGRRD